MRKLRKVIKLENGKNARLDEKLIFVKLKAPVENKKLAKQLEKYGVKPFKLEKGEFELNKSANFFFLESDNVDADSLMKLEELFGGECDYVSNVFYSDKDRVESYFSLVPNSLVISANVEANDPNLIKLLKRYDLQVDELKSRYLSGNICLKVSSKADVYNIKKRLERSRKFISKVYLEKVPLVSPFCGVPNDTLYSQQWNLGITEWHKDYSQCPNDVVVAIIDQGCDLHHPDLNFSSTGMNMGTMLPNGSPTGPHGTPCAGIAAGTVNNNLGVAGISGKSKILPIALQTVSDVEVAMAINYAATYGAAVISMSFGVYDFWGMWNYEIIDPEIVYAHNLGVFMCAATGNENVGDLNRYPSKHPLVLSVGGSNKDDMRKSVGDNSSQANWGANYGLEQYQNSWVGVGVVAPCLEIPSTDNLGSSGYTPNEYTSFGGTSAATPMVAGLATLIKANFPTMNNIDIRKVIEKSADKIGGYTYSFDPRFPSSAWTQETGHGRINVRKAMEMATKIFNCHGAKNACSCEKHEVIAIAVEGKSHVSQGGDQQVAFQQIITNEGGSWMNDTFIVPKKGSYYFDLNMVKDSFYHGGTQDDVSLHLLVNNSQSYGSAWSGEKTGRRGTGAFSTILKLDAGDQVKVYVHSDGGHKRHVASYALSVHSL